MDRREIRNKITESFNQLDSIEQNVIGLRYGILSPKCHTLTEVAEILNISRVDVRRIERNCLTKMNICLEEKFFVYLNNPIRSGRRGYHDFGNCLYYSANFINDPNMIPDTFIYTTVDPELIEQFKNNNNVVLYSTNDGGRTKVEATNINEDRTDAGLIFRFTLVIHDETETVNDFIRAGILYCMPSDFAITYIRRKTKRGKLLYLINDSNNHLSADFLRRNSIIPKYFVSIRFLSEIYDDNFVRVNDFDDLSFDSHRGYIDGFPPEYFKYR